MSITIQVDGTTNHPSFRENTVIGTLAATILAMPPGGDLAVSAIKNAWGEPCEWTKIRMFIGTISKRTNRRFTTRLVDDVLHIKALN